MNQITLETPAKINLSLDITGLRQDGYHLVQMLMQTVSCYDVVTVKRLTDTSDVTMDCDVPGLPTDEKNLCVKAARAMQQAFGITDGFHIVLSKRIPMAAGLAGGSTDAAAVMRAIDELEGLHLRIEDLERVALPLGADIPYCIRGGLMLSEGIGEILTPLPELPKRYILLVKPDVDVSTGAVYKAYDSLAPEEITHPDTKYLLSNIENGNWAGLLSGTHNVLEDVTRPMVPAIEAVEQQLLELGADGTMMSGSGPTVFGVFTLEARMKQAADALREIHPRFEIKETETCAI